MINAAGYAATHSSSRLKRFEFQREEAKADEVETQVLFCSVCHSGIRQVEDEWSNTVPPCLPGHEMVGRVARVGSAVTRHEVGVGCRVDSTRQCGACLSGEQGYREGPKGWLSTYDDPMVPKGEAPDGGNMYGKDNTHGGCSDVLVVREDFAPRIPAGLRPEVAAPILGVANRALAMHRKTVGASLTGKRADPQEILDFCALHQIGPEVEVIPIDPFDDAYDKAEKGEVRFRDVVEMASPNPGLER